MRIVFMGTPDFAVGCLEALVNSEHSVCAVFCQPDRPKNRGQKLIFPPVKECAIKHCIPVFQPESLKTGEAYDQLNALCPDCIVVAAYGKLLPKDILSLPKYGCINVHASLLPKYRGAAPIQWAIINGEAQTGVTIMQMDVGLDTGDILAQRTFVLDEKITAGELFDALSEMGAKLICDTLSRVERGEVLPQKQGAGESYSPMLTRENAKIDWTKPARDIYNLVRGLNPWPVAYTVSDGEIIKIYSCEIINGANGSPGEIIDKKNFTVCCGDKNALRLCEVQLTGKKRMPAADMLRGHKIQGILE